MSELNPLSPPLTPEQEKWLQALESGEWKQTRNELHSLDETRHCCLGVAHCLVGIDITNFRNAIYSTFGMTTAGWRKCIHMNDEDEKSFTEIAQAIRSDPSGFFAPLPKAEASNG